jgi:STE24 endopeptidase
MAAVLQNIQQRLQDPAIDYQTILLCIALGVGAFESWIGYAASFLCAAPHQSSHHCTFDRHRQKPFLSSILHPTLPATLKPFLPSKDSEETYRKSQAYNKDKLTYASFIGRIDLLESFLLLSSVTAPVFAVLGLGSVVQSAFPWFGGNKGRWTLLKGFWDLAGGVPGATTDLKQSLAFVALMTTLGTILSLPKEYYKNFVLEEKHGFNKTTKGELYLPTPRLP